MTLNTDNNSIYILIITLLTHNNSIILIITVKTIETVETIRIHEKKTVEDTGSPPAADCRVTPMRNSIRH